MKISRRSFILGGAATIAAAGASPILTGCSQRAKSGLDFSKFETKRVSKFRKDGDRYYSGLQSLWNPMG